MCSRYHLRVHTGWDTHHDTMKNCLVASTPPRINLSALLTSYCMQNAVQECAGALVLGMGKYLLWISLLDDFAMV